ncbi:hypothetical protein BH23BAC1_BH23BAC1_09290 [soil metagenome]
MGALYKSSDHFKNKEVDVLVFSRGSRCNLLLFRIIIIRRNKIIKLVYKFAGGNIK